MSDDSLRGQACALEKHVSRELAHCGRALGGHVGIEALADDVDDLAQAEPFDELAGSHVLRHSRRRAGVAQPAFTVRASAVPSHGFSFAVEIGRHRAPA